MSSAPHFPSPASPSNLDINAATSHNSANRPNQVNPINSDAAQVTAADFPSDSPLRASSIDVRAEVDSEREITKPNKERPEQHENGNSAQKSGKSSNSKSKGGVWAEQDNNFTNNHSNDINQSDKNDNFLDNMVKAPIPTLAELGETRGMSGTVIYPIYEKEEITERSLYLFSPNNRVRMQAISLAEATWFKRFMLIIIVLNCIILVLDAERASSSGSAGIFLFFDIIFAVVFVLELIVKLIAGGMAFAGPTSYFRSVWNWLDFIVTFFSIMIFIPGVSNFTYLKILRLLRPIKASYTISGIRVMMVAVWQSSVAALNVLLLVALLLFTFGLLGLQMNKDHYHFRCLAPDPANAGAFLVDPAVVYGFVSCNPTAGSIPGISSRRCPLGTECVDVGMNPYAGAMGWDHIGQSFLMSLLVMSGEGWTDAMYMSEDCVGKLSLIFYIGLTVLANFLAQELLVAVMAVRFEEAKEKERQKINQENERGDMKHRRRLSLLASVQNLNQLQSASNIQMEQLPPKLEKTEDNMTNLPLSQLSRQGNYSFLGRWFLNYRFLCHRLIFNKASVYFGYLLTLINVIVLGCYYYGMSSAAQDQLNGVSNALMALFIVEFIMRFSALGPKYFKNNYFTVDLIVILISILDIAVPSQRFTRSLRAFRVFRMFSIFQNYSNMKVLMRQIKRSIDDLFYFSLLGILFVFICAFIGNQFSKQYSFHLSQGYGRSHMKSVGWAAIVTFQITTPENWNQVLYDFHEQIGWAAGMYIVFILVVGHYVVESLFVVVMLANFGAESEEQLQLAQTQQKSDIPQTAILPVNETPAIPAEITDSAAKYEAKPLPQQQAEELPVIPRIHLQSIEGSLNSVVDRASQAASREASILGPDRESSVIGQFGEEIKSNSFDPLDSEAGHKLNLLQRIQKNIKQSNQVAEQQAKQRAELEIIGHTPRGRANTTVGLTDAAQVAQKGLQMKAEREQSVLRRAERDDEGDSQRHSFRRQRSSSLAIAGNLNFSENSFLSGGVKGKSHKRRQTADMTELELVGTANQAVLGPIAGDEKVAAGERATVVFVEDTDESQNEAKKRPQVFSQHSNIVEMHVADLPELGTEAVGSQDAPGNQFHPEFYRVHMIPHHYVTRTRFFETPLPSKFEHRSLFLMAPDNPFRNWLSWLIHHRIFNIISFGLILLSCIILILDYPGLSIDSQRHKALFALDYVVIIGFMFESVLRIIVYGFVLHRGAYLRDIWNIIEIIIIVLMIISLGYSSSPVLRALRGLRSLRIVARVEQAKVIIISLGRSMSNLAHVIIIAFILMYLLGLVGVQLFGGRLQQCLTIPTANVIPVNQLDCGKLNATVWTNAPWMGNYDTIFSSMLVMFELSTEENWPGIMYMGIDATEPGEAKIIEYNQYYGFYFVICILIGSLFIKNLFTATILDGYTLNYAQITGSGLRTELTSYQQVWLDFYKAAIDNIPVESKPRPIVRWFSRADLKIRQKLYDLCHSKQFEWVFLAVIAFNVALLAIQFTDQPLGYTHVLNILNAICTLFFIIEIILLWLGFGVRIYFHSYRNMFDFCVTVLLCLEFFLTFNIIPNSIGFDPSFFRVLRLTRIIKVLSKFPRLVQLADTVLFALPSLYNVAGVLLLLFYTYSIFTMNLFAPVKFTRYMNEHGNFQDFASAIVTLFRMVTGENWNGIMRDCMISEPFCDPGVNCGYSILSPLVFVTFMVLASMLILDLIIAIVLNQFENELDKEQRTQVDFINITAIKHFVDIWSRVSRGKFTLPVARLTSFLMELSRDELCRNAFMIPSYIDSQGTTYIDEEDSYSFIDSLNLPCNERSVHYLDTIYQLAERAFYKRYNALQPATETNRLLATGLLDNIDANPAELAKYNVLPIGILELLEINHYYYNCSSEVALANEDIQLIRRQAQRSFPGLRNRSEWINNAGYINRVVLIQKLFRGFLGRKHSPLAPQRMQEMIRHVRSASMRSVNEAYQAQGITIGDAIRFKKLNSHQN
jgi:hypothetical protein